jgi:hypothetical protein
MNSPGFTAESSLYRSRQSYRAARERGHTSGRGTVCMAQAPMELTRPSPQIAHQAAVPTSRSERSSIPLPPIHGTESPNCAGVLWSALTATRQVIQSPPVVFGNKCSADNKAVIATDGRSYDCSPYLCQAGACQRTCASVNDCAAPFVCNTDGQCIYPPTQSSYDD